MLLNTATASYHSKLHEFPKQIHSCKWCLTWLVHVLKSLDNPKMVLGVNFSSTCPTGQVGNKVNVRPVVRKSILTSIIELQFTSCHKTSRMIFLVSGVK